VQYQVPTVVERKCQVTSDIPGGSHVLISLGAAVNTEKVRGLPRLINEFCAAAGLPEPIAFVPCERLVVITPEPIILEPEGQPTRPASRAGSGARVR
jgi:hypothetical protein